MSVCHVINRLISWPNALNTNSSCEIAARRKEQDREFNANELEMELQLGLPNTLVKTIALWPS